MTLYEHLMTLAEDLLDGDGEGDLSIPVTSLMCGVGYCTELSHADAHHPYPIRVEFASGDLEEGFTADGKFRTYDQYPQIAVGHYDTQEETLAAIKEQNFKLLPQEPAE